VRIVLIEKDIRCQVDCCGRYAAVILRRHFNSRQPFIAI